MLCCTQNRWANKGKEYVWAYSSFFISNYMVLKMFSSHECENKLRTLPYSLTWKTTSLTLHCCPNKDTPWDPQHLHSLFWHLYQWTNQPETSKERKFTISKRNLHYTLHSIQVLETLRTFSFALSDLSSKRKTVSAYAKPFGESETIVWD